MGEGPKAGSAGSKEMTVFACVRDFFENGCWCDVRSWEHGGVVSGRCTNA